MNWIAMTAFLMDQLFTLGNQVAYVMMKRALISVEKTGINGEAKQSPYFKKSYLLGFLLLFIGSAGHVACLSFCDIVLLSTSTATGIIMSSILAIKYLGEKPVWKYDIASISLIVVGCLTICFLSNYNDKMFTVEEIERLLFRPVSICFLSFFVFTGTFTLLYWQWFYR